MQADAKGGGADGRAEVKKEKVAHRPVGTPQEVSAVGGVVVVEWGLDLCVIRWYQHASRISIDLNPPPSIPHNTQQLEQARRLQQATGLGVEEALTALRANGFNQERAIRSVVVEKMMKREAACHTPLCFYAYSSMRTLSSFHTAGSWMRRTRTRWRWR